MPSVAASVSAVLGGISVLGGGLQISFLIMKILLALIATIAFERALNVGTSWFFPAVLVAGLVDILPYFDVGFFVACALCAASGRICVAAIVGIVLDLSGAYGRCALFALSVPAVLLQGFPHKEKTMTCIAYGLLPAAAFFCFAELDFSLMAASVAGSVAGVLLQGAMPSVLVAPMGDASVKRLLEAQKLMQTLSDYLPEEVVSVSQNEAEEVYDAAAERVCRCCPRFHRCWEHHAAETYVALSSAAHSIIERGTAQADDFSPDFRENCCHLEGFVIALNQELEGMLYRRRYRMQLRESRQVLSQELQCLAEFLCEAQKEPYAKSDTVFLPQVGVSALSKKGERISGDCGTYFMGANADFYVLLCDGMGSGEAAALGSSETVHLMRRLLKSGISADSALKILNGMQILRQAQSYTTVDLLRIDLDTGSARLYKWGAAPSFLKQFDAVKKIGTATAPPGVSIHHQAEQYSFSLKHDEIFVLASDGNDAQRIETVLSSYRGGSPRELAALLAGTQGDDDATAVAVSLRLRNG